MLRGRFVSAPMRVPLGAKGIHFDHADIEFEGVDQSGPSFEARVFLNNPQANAKTPPTPENGYAGSFHVYGYGIWPEDVGKDAQERAAGAERIRAPIHKTVVATEAVRTALSHGEEVTITVVPVFGNPPQDADGALKLEDVRIVVR
jgi:hypothetical protein